MSYKQALYLVLTLIVVPSAHAGDTGTTSADFLKLGVGPRAVAMGDAQVALADDVFATYWNPAGLAQLRAKEIGLVNTQYVQSITQQYAAFAMPLSHNSGLGLSVSYLGSGSFQGYDAAGAPIGNISAHDADIGMSYGRYLLYDERTGNGIAAGLTVKWIQESLDYASAQAYAADIGLLYTPGLAWGENLRGLKFGLSARNFGSSMTFDQVASPLPRVYTAGTSWTGNLLHEDVTLTGDVSQPNDGTRFGGVGIEILTLQALVLRAGYTTEGDFGNGLRMGIGLKFKTVTIDYAFANEGDFGATHRFGVTFRFEPTPADHLKEAQRWYESGMHAYNRHRYTEAIVDFNKALQIDPTHPQALEMMKKTYEDIKNLVPAQ